MLTNYGRLSIELDKNIANYYFIKLDEKIIGSFILTSLHDVTIKFFNFSIEENYRNKGLGKQTLYLIMDKAKELGATHLQLDAMLSNVRAQHIYKCVGFTEIGRTNYSIIFSKKQIAGL